MKELLCQFDKAEHVVRIKGNRNTAKFKPRGVIPLVRG